MDNEFTAFRQNVQDMFERELEVRMFPGLMEGPNQALEWVGSLLLHKVQEDPQRTAEQNLYLVLRVFAPYNPNSAISPDVPAYDPTPLEGMMAKILGAIARNQTGLGAWYQRVTAIEIDADTQGVQATVFAYSSNSGIGFNA